MVITERTHQGFFSRLAGSLVGVLIGFFLVPGSLVLIGWNEYRTIHRTRGLLEAEQVVQELRDPFELPASLENRLVHTIGPATTEETLADPQFDVSRVALRLERQVRMYQWVEKKETKTQDKLGGGRETITTYEYEKRWVEGREPSERFRDSSGHTNPPLRYERQSLVAQAASLGQLRLTPEQVARIDAWQELPFELDRILTKIPASDRIHFAIEGHELYYGAATPDASHPKVGDLRILFRAVDPTQVSVLGQLSGDRIQPFRTSNGEWIESIEAGQKSSEEMFKTLRMQNAVLAWVLRGVGWLLACVGFGLITGPLSALASVLPILGRLAGGVSLVVALVLGSCMAVTAIALAWIAVRPLWALGLLAAVAASLYWLARKK